MAERAASLRDHYATTVTQHMKNYLAGDDAAVDHLVASLQQANEDVAQIEVKVWTAKRGDVFVKGRTAFEGLSNDAAVILKLRPCIEAALGVEESKLDVYDNNRWSYNGSTRLHGVYKLALDACDRNTPDLWRVALTAAAEYLEFFHTSNGHQRHLKPTTADGSELLPRFHAWQNRLTCQVYGLPYEDGRLYRRHASAMSVSIPRRNDGVL